MKTYFNASELAKLLDADRATVSRWIRKGLITNAVRVGDEQQWRIPVASYEELVRRQHEGN